VVFVGLNRQGSNDTYSYAGMDGQTHPQAEIDCQRSESVAGKAVNLHWRNEGVEFAKQEDAAGVMAIIQADLKDEYHLVF
jgi:hypothetical protein